MLSGVYEWRYIDLSFSWYNGHRTNHHTDKAPKYLSYVTIILIMPRNLANVSTGAAFACDWSAMRAFMHESHPWLQHTNTSDYSGYNGEDEWSETQGSFRTSTTHTSNRASSCNVVRRSLMLGQLACTVHNDRQVCA